MEVNLGDVGENDIVFCYGRACRGKTDLLEWINLLKSLGTCSDSDSDSDFRIFKKPHLNNNDYTKSLTNEMPKGATGKSD